MKTPKPNLQTQNPQELEEWMMPRLPPRVNPANNIRYGTLTLAIRNLVWLPPHSPNPNHITYKFKFWGETTPRLNTQGKMTYQIVCPVPAFFDYLRDMKVLKLQVVDMRNDKTLAFIFVNLLLYLPANLKQLKVYERLPMFGIQGKLKQGEAEVDILVQEVMERIPDPALNINNSSIKKEPQLPNYPNANIDTFQPKPQVDHNSIPIRDNIYQVPHTFDPEQRFPQPARLLTNQLSYMRQDNRRSPAQEAIFMKKEKQRKVNEWDRQRQEIERQVSMEKMKVLGRRGNLDLELERLRLDEMEFLQTGKPSFGYQGVESYKIQPGNAKTQPLSFVVKHCTFRSLTLQDVTYKLTVQIPVLLRGSISEDTFTISSSQCIPQKHTIVFNQNIQVRFQQQSPTVTKEYMNANGSFILSLGYQQICSGTVRVSKLIDSIRSDSESLLSIPLKKTGKQLTDMGTLTLSPSPQSLKARQKITETSSSNNQAQVVSPKGTNLPVKQTYNSLDNLLLSVSVGQLNNMMSSFPIALNSRLKLKLCGHSLESDTFWNQSSPIFNFEGCVVPRVAEDTLRGDLLIVEVWNKAKGDNDHLLGMARIKFADYLQVCEKYSKNECKLRENMFPYIAFEGDVPLKSLKDVLIGYIWISLSIGTPQQINTFLNRNRLVKNTNQNIVREEDGAKRKISKDSRQNNTKRTTEREEKKNRDDKTDPKRERRRYITHNNQEHEEENQHAVNPSSENKIHISQEDEEYSREHERTIQQHEDKQNSLQRIKTLRKDLSELELLNEFLQHLRKHPRSRFFREYLSQPSHQHMSLQQFRTEVIDASGLELQEWKISKITYLFLDNLAISGAEVLASLEAFETYRDIIIVQFNQCLAKLREQIDLEALTINNLEQILFRLNSHRYETSSPEQLKQYLQQVLPGTSVKSLERLFEVSSCANIGTFCDNLRKLDVFEGIEDISIEADISANLIFEQFNQIIKGSIHNQGDQERQQNKSLSAIEVDEILKETAKKAPDTLIDWRELMGLFAKIKIQLSVWESLNLIQGLNRNSGHSNSYVSCGKIQEWLQNYSLVHSQVQEREPHASSKKDINKGLPLQPKDKQSAQSLNMNKSPTFRHHIFQNNSDALEKQQKQPNIPNRQPQQSNPVTVPGAWKPSSVPLNIPQSIGIQLRIQDFLVHRVIVNQKEAKCSEYRKHGNTRKSEQSQVLLLDEVQSAQDGWFCITLTNRRNSNQILFCEGEMGEWLPVIDQNERYRGSLRIVNL